MSNRSGNSEVYKMKAKPEGKRNRPVNLSKHSSADDLRPNWSPDGLQIVFSSSRGIGGDYEIYKMKSDGTDQAPLTENSAGDSEPAFSPDGAKIALMSTRAGELEVWTMSADGSAPANATNFPFGSDFASDWQPL